MAKLIPLGLWASLNDINEGSVRRLARSGRLVLDDGEPGAFKIAPRMWLVHPLATITKVQRGGKRAGSGRKKQRK